MQTFAPRPTAQDFRVEAEAASSMMKWFKTEIDRLTIQRKQLLSIRINLPSEFDMGRLIGLIDQEIERLDFEFVQQRCRFAYAYDRMNRAV